MNISQHCFMPSTQLRSGYYSASNVFVSNTTSYTGSCFPCVNLTKLLSLCHNVVRLFSASSKLQMYEIYPIGKLTVADVSAIPYYVRVSNSSSGESRTSWAKHYPSVVFF